MNSLRLSAKDEKSLEKTMATSEPASRQWYTIEELASLCGFSVETLQKGNSPLNSLSLDFEVETRLGGYHNTKKFYSENVLKALKEYQVRNAVPNAVKTMTVKEVAEAMGVSYSAVDRAVTKLFPNKKQNGKTTFLDEQEVSCISKELKGHHNLFSTEKVKNTLTDLEILENAVTSFAALKDLYERKEAEYKAIIAEQKPKALVYDRICNADGLKPVEQVASNLGWGKNNFFALMRGMGIFFYSARDADGRKTNLPKREYVERGYFVTKEEPYTRGDKDRLYTKIYVTGKGETWLANKLNEAVEDSAEKIIEKDIAKKSRRECKASS